MTTMERLRTLTADFVRNDRGSIFTTFGIALIPMLVAGGAAVDYSRASSNRSQLQSALDAAVLGAVGKPVDQRSAEATRIFNANLPAGIAATGLTFQTRADGSLQGDVGENVVNKFASFAGYSRTTPVKVTSIAAPGTVPAAPPASPSDVGVCILVLDPSGNQSLLVNSGATVIAPQCEVHVRSTARPAAIFNAGTKLTAKRFCIAGTDVIQNSTVVRNLELGCTTANDIFAGRFAAPSTGCTVSSQNYSGTVTLNPGVYCGWFNFNGVTDVTFTPGTYVIKDGGWNVSGGSFKGTGVTFYFADTSKIQFNSSMDTDLTPPTSGPLKGVLFYEASSLAKSDFIFNNAIRNRMEGLIYLPSRNVTFNADSKMTNESTTLVINRLIWNNVSMKIQPNPDQMIPSTLASSTPTPPVASRASGPKLVR